MHYIKAFSLAQPRQWSADDRGNIRFATKYCIALLEKSSSRAPLSRDQKPNFLRFKAGGFDFDHDLPFSTGLDPNGR